VPDPLFGYLVVWLFGCLVIWLFGCLVVWLFGCLVIWLFGCLVVWLLRALCFASFPCPAVVVLAATPPHPTTLCG
jgi:hypothetical protein